MNRKQRRATLKAGSSSARTSLDPDDQLRRLFMEAAGHECAQKLDDAVRAYKRILTIKADHAEACNSLGRVLQTQGKTEDAARSYARALALMHRDMTRSWTVDELGREVGLSRSALAERFTRLIGVAPMHYLANWRMQVAAQELRNRNASLAQVARKVGYESEAAFSRAFKKAFGTAPATWGRSRNQAVGDAS